MANNKNTYFEGNEITDEQLIKYVQGTASEEELFAIEKVLKESEFMQEAVEGLKHFSSDKNLHEYVHQLNKNLHQQLSNRKKRDKNSYLKHLYWSVLTVLIVLLLCILAYTIIRMQRKKEEQVKMQTASVIVKG